MTVYKQYNRTVRECQAGKIIFWSKNGGDSELFGQFMVRCQQFPGTEFATVDHFLQGVPDIHRHIFTLRSHLVNLAYIKLFHYNI